MVQSYVYLCVQIFILCDLSADCIDINMTLTMYSFAFQVHFRLLFSGTVLKMVSRARLLFQNSESHHMQQQ